jgi:hypothetical protein
LISLVFLVIWIESELRKRVLEMIDVNLHVVTAPVILLKNINNKSLRQYVNQIFDF